MKIPFVDLTWMAPEPGVLNVPGVGRVPAVVSLAAPEHRDRVRAALLWAACIALDGFTRGRA